MKELGRFLKKNPLGVTAPILLLGATIAGDLSLPSIVSTLFFIAGGAALFIHFFSAVGPWFSKRISYGEAIANGIGPVMLIWIVAIFVRAAILGILGKPL